MSNNKGLTLIEIIISIALLGIISITFLSSISSYFSMLSNTKNITQDVFAAQKTIEDEIEAVKNEVNAGGAPSGPQTYTLFTGADQRAVTAYPREVVISNNRKIFTIVADTRMPEFIVPVASDPGLTPRINDVVVAHSYALEPNTSMKVTSVVNPNGVFLLNKHEWFVSSAGFNIPMVKNPDNLDEDNDLGRLYPLFPEDYVPVPIKSESNQLNVSSINADMIKNYPGRHIIYTISPFAVSGKKGATVFSNPVFLSGLPILNGLKLHLDASFVSKENTEGHVRVVSPDEIYAKQWPDLSRNGNNAEQNHSSSQPRLGEVIYDANQWGKSLSGILGTSMDIGSFTPSTTSQLSVVVAAKVKQNHANGGLEPINPIIKGGETWGFGWTDTGSLGYYIKSEDIAIDNYYATQYKTPDDKWHVFTGILTTNDLKFRIDGHDVSVSLDSSLSTINTDSITINWHPNLEIGEVLIYDRDISGDDLDDIENYLYDKYNPTAEIINIQSIHPIYASVIRGQTYTLPAAVTANMSNGTTREVEVIWNPTTLDTSTAGLKNSIGTAVLDNSKVVFLSVNVLTIDALNHVIETVNQGQYYPMPSTVTANLSDGSAKNVSVTWNPAVIDTSILGTKTSMGRAVLDNTKTMTLTVHVNPVAVSGVTLNKSSTSIFVGSSELLEATVNPSNAANNNVTWSSSNPSVASVTNGLIHGISPGSATIIVTTADGGFNASCSVTVKPQGPIAQSISPGTLNRSQFHLTFDKNILSTSLDVSDTNVTINNNVVTFTRSSNFNNNQEIDIHVTSIDGGQSTVTVRRNGNSWSIIRQN